MFALLLAALSPVEYGGPQRAQNAAAIASILARPIFEECVERLAGMALWRDYEPPVPRSALGAIAGFQQGRGSGGDESLLALATVTDAALHMDQHIGMESPLAVAGRAVLDTGLKMAVQYVASFRADPAALKLDRQERLKVIHKCAADLWPLTEECRRHMPKHILNMKEPKMHIALIACCVRACGLPDLTLHEDCALGFRVCGPVPYSGMFRHDREAEAASDYDRMQSDPLWCDPVWNQRLHAGLLADGRNPAKRADIETIWAASIKEAKAGWTHGPFTFGQISHRFPEGKRCVRRFGVTQKGVCRPCDDCKGNGINACAQMFERLVCCTPELAADIAAEFSAVFGDFDWKPRFCTDDVEKAYRRLGTATPFLTVVGVTDPRPSSEGGVGVAYFVLPGHNFGLKSAPVSFNRAAACMALCSNRLLGICCSHYYDDFLTLEPAYAASWGKHFLREFMRTNGLPLSDDAAKNVVYRAVNTFLGVVTDFSDFENDGTITMQVTPERINSIIETMVEMQGDASMLTSGSLSSLCGRLRFVLCWTFGRFGSAAMQPLETYANDGVLASAEAVARALQFFVTILGLYRKGRGLVRMIRLGKPAKPPIVVWSDAMWDRSRAGSPAGLGFVIYVPSDAPGAKGRLLHSSVRPDARTMDFFMRNKKQYIGQLELLAATACYYSCPDIFRDRDVVHFIDNTSAIAALLKGYSGVPDSARIVHAFHSLNAGLRVRPWFQYVASKANVSDLPSRGDNEELMDVLGRFRDRCVIEEVTMVVPPFDKWDAPFSVWLDHVRAAAEVSAKRNRRR